MRFFKSVYIQQEDEEQAAMNADESLANMMDQDNKFFPPTGYQTILS